MAHQSVLEMFNVLENDISASFGEMQVLEDGADNAFLLFSSALLMHIAHDTQGETSPTAVLSEWLSNARIDLKHDGDLDSIVQNLDINNALQNLNQDRVRTTMEAEYPDAVIPPFESYLPVPVVFTGEISGSILYRGKGLKGADVLISGDMQETRYTDDAGWYQFENIAAGTYIVTPRMDEFQFNPGKIEVVHTGQGFYAADFEAIATAKSIFNLEEFTDITGDNEISDFESSTFGTGVDGDTYGLISHGAFFTNVHEELTNPLLLEHLSELVSLEHAFWFSGEASPPTFVLCNNPGFNVTFESDVRAMGFFYSPFGSDVTIHESLIRWTLFDENNQIIEMSMAPAYGFAANVDIRFFGIVSPIPFRSAEIRRTKSDGSEGYGNWMFDDVRWASEIDQDPF